MAPREQELERFRAAVDRTSDEAREAAESARDSPAGGTGGKGKRTADAWNQ